MTSVLLLLPFSLSSVSTLTDSNFDELTASSAWLVEFYAPWCGHCKKLMPIFEEASTKVTAQVSLGKVDCTSEKELARRFNIRGYPTVLFIRDGVVRKYKGSRTVEGIKKYCEEMGREAVQVREEVGMDGENVVFVLVGEESEEFGMVAKKFQGLAEFVRVPEFEGWGKDAVEEREGCWKAGMDVEEGERTFEMRE